MVSARSSRPGDATPSSSPWTNPALFPLGFSVVLSLVVIFGLASYRDSFSESAASWFAGMAGGSGHHGSRPGAAILEHGAAPTSSAFTLMSSDSSLVDGGTLPAIYTCNADNGVGVSPPFYWENAPKETQQFLILMQTDAYHENIYLYTRDDWTIYGIDSSVSDIKADNAGGVGIKGGTYPGVSMHLYNAPCPFGSGYYTYNFVLIALNADMAGIVAKSITSGKTDADIGITMAEQAKANGLIAATTQMTVTFCRTGCETADTAAFAERNKQSHFFGDVAESPSQGQPVGSKADAAATEDLVVTEGGNMKIDNARPLAPANTVTSKGEGEGGDSAGLAPFHKEDEPTSPTVVDVPFTQATKGDTTAAPKAGGSTGAKEIPAIAALVPKTTSPKGSSKGRQLRREQ